MRSSGVVARKRIIEDIPESAAGEPSNIPLRDYCPACDKIVEPVVTDALPNSSIGNGILVLRRLAALCPGQYAFADSWCSTPIFIFRCPRRPGPVWHRLADSCWRGMTRLPGYPKRGVLHGDETAGCQQQKTGCGALRARRTIFRLSGPAAPVVLGSSKMFDGVLVATSGSLQRADGCANRIAGASFAGAERVVKYKTPAAWRRQQEAQTATSDAIRLRRRKRNWTQPPMGGGASGWNSGCNGSEHGWSNQAARRLLRRLIRHQTSWLTFLHHGRSVENNFGERSNRGP